MSRTGWKTDGCLRSSHTMNDAANECAREFRADWGKHHDGRQPLGFVLRQDACVPWVRFHALPGSKRYAETEQEWDNILSRGNSLAMALFGDAAECWIITSRWDDVAGAGAPAGLWREDESEPDGAVFKFFVRKEAWAQGKFDDDLEELADDAAHHMVWFEPRNGRIFAPYDGGFDLFLSSSEEVQTLKDHFADWLPDRPDGL